MQEVSPQTADRVRDALAHRGITQRDLADAIALEPTKLSKALSGRRRFTPAELKDIAGTLDVSVDWLVGGEDIGRTVARPPVSTALSDDLYSGAGGHTRRQIIDAAWILIAERGYHAVRVGDVAAKCGISAAAVHYHFENRVDLLEEALRVSVRKAYDRQVAELETYEDGYERLLHLLELQLPKPGLLRLEWSIWLQVWNQTALDPRLRGLHAAAYSRWHNTIRSAVELGQRQGLFVPGDAGEFALRLTALIDGLGIQILTGRPGCSIDTMRETLHDFLRTQVVAGDVTRTSTREEGR